MVIPRGDMAEWRGAKVVRKRVCTELNSVLALQHAEELAAYHTYDVVYYHASNSHFRSQNHPLTLITTFGYLLKSFLCFIKREYLVHNSVDMCVSIEVQSLFEPIPRSVPDTFNVTFLRRASTLVFTTPSALSTFPLRYPIH